ncbi:ATP-binding protein [Deinococcus arboris]|nr:ATP-binding protein [Deinococcus arboris]
MPRAASRPTPPQDSHLLLQAVCESLSAQVLDAALSEQGDPEATFEVVLPEEASQTRLGALQQGLGLTEFELGVMALALATELYPERMLAACGTALQLDGPYTGFLTPSLCRRWLPGADWTEMGAFQAGSALTRYHLIEFGQSVNSSVLESLTPLRLTAGALAFLRGDEGVALELRSVTQPLGAGGLLSDSQEQTLQTASKHLSRQGNERAALLYGSQVQAMRSLAGHLLAGSGRTLLLDVAALATRSPEALDVTLRALDREGRVTAAPLVLDVTGDAPEGQTLDDLTTRLLGVATGPCVILAPEPLPLDSARALLPLEVTAPTSAEQRERWGQALGVSGEPPLLRQLGDQYQLSLERIDTLAREARAALPGNAAHQTRIERAWEAAKTANRRLMGSLAQRIETRAGWDDLILPPADRAALEQIAAHVRHRSQVYEDMGMARPGRGRSIAALFSGPSGTGKTLSAEVLARDLNLDLYRVDLSSTVSKYIGETEKNLKKIFDAADQGGCVLLFDEADSVFGKRGEVRDSNDRYANVQVNYLLQRLESFNGLAVLTTNMESSMDVAFMRRLQFVINFRAPQAQERERLWRGAFPRTLDTSMLDFPRLAAADVAGGNIRSVVMNTVFMAVARGVPLSQPLVEEALHLEYRKLGRLVL